MKDSLKKLKRTDLKNIMGGVSTGPIVGPIKPGGQCGCDCMGRVTGPKYCQDIWACPQVITC